MKGLCMNVAGLDGGVAFNVVPDEASLYWSTRPPPGFDKQAFEAEVAALINAIDPAIRVEPTLGHQPFACSDEPTMRALLADHVDHFVATSDFYAEFMCDYLGISSERMSVARIGISLDGHRDPSDSIEVSTEEPLVLGFLARLCPEKGLHHLCGAFRQLSGELGKGKIRLRVAGYLGGRDKAYVADLIRQIEDWGLSEDFDLVGEVDREEKIRFLQSLDVLSVPTTYREAKGLSILEALANGIPVVQPRHGAFPELVGRTGGGILVEPDSVDALSQGILDLWRDPQKRRELSDRGRVAVHRDYSADVMAQRTLAIYAQVLDR